MKIKERFQMWTLMSLTGVLVLLEWVGEKLNPAPKRTGPSNYQKPLGDRVWQGRPLGHGDQV